MRPFSVLYEESRKGKPLTRSEKQRLLQSLSRSVITGTKKEPVLPRISVNRRYAKMTSKNKQELNNLFTQNIKKEFNQKIKKIESDLKKLKRNLRTRLT